MDEPAAKRVAVIVMHGVGNQTPGQTVCSVAQTLQATHPYSAFMEGKLSLPVDHGFAAHAEDPDAPPRNSLRSLGFHSNLWSRRKTPVGRQLAGDDADHAFTDLLVSQAGNNMQMQAASKLSGQRLGKDDAEQINVDLHEFYWADLSRARSGLRAFFGQLLQLLVHIASLGRLTSVMAALQAPGRTTASWYGLHAASYWLLAMPIVIWSALLGVPLALLIPVLVPPHWLLPSIYGISALAGAAVLAAACLKSQSRPLARALMPAALLLGGLLGGLLSYVVLSEFLLAATSWLAAFLLAASLLAAYLLLTIYRQARSGAMTFGLLSLALMLAVIVWLWHESGTPVFNTGAPFVVAIASGLFELTVMGILLAWGAFFVTGFLTLLTGALLKILYAQTFMRASAFTARLAIALPASLYLILMLGASTALLGALGQFETFRCLPFKPVTGLFRSMLGTASPDPCSNTASDFGQVLLNLGGGAFFGLFLVFIGVATVLLISGFLPSALAEANAGKNHAASADAPANLSDALDRAFIVGRVAAWFVFTAFFFWLPLGSLSMLLKIDLSVGNVTALLAGLGGPAFLLAVLSGRFNALTKRITPAIDIALDVDNWLRERPVQNTPRARIAARFAALLKHIGQSGQYDGVVIVAHSQGTVIAADILRYLERLDRNPLATIKNRAMLTVGSPLRQLYAQRFPLLYHWAVKPLSSMQSGPDPAALSMQTWVNGFCTGDYVGRQLWDGSPVPAWDESFDAAAFVKAVSESALPVSDFCCGTGAHTRYFSGAFPAVGGVIDALVMRVAR